MSEPFVVKVQRSIVTNATKPTMLIYDSSREVEYQTELSKAVAKAMGDRFKCYWWATVTSKGYHMTTPEDRPSMSLEEYLDDRIAELKQQLKGGTAALPQRAVNWRCRMNISKRKYIKLAKKVEKIFDKEKN